MDHPAPVPSPPLVSMLHATLAAYEPGPDIGALSRTVVRSAEILDALLGTVEEQWRDELRLDEVASARGARNRMLAVVEQP